MEGGIIIFSILMILVIARGVDRLIFLIKKFRYRRYLRATSMQHYGKNEVVRLPSGAEYKVIGSHGDEFWVEQLKEGRW